MKANIPSLNVKFGRSVAAMTAGMTGQPVWTDYDSALQAIEGYRKNHVVFTCVHEISKSAGSVPFKLVKTSAGTKMKNHPILELLKRPNPFQAAGSFWECVYAFYLLHGNSYVEAADSASSERPSTIEELYCLPPKMTKVVLGQRGVGMYLFEGPTGTKVEFPVSIMNGQSFCMHWKTFNPDNIWVGQSAISALGKSVDIHNSTNSWNKALLDNGARPSGVFVYDDDDKGVLTDEQYKRLKEEMAEEYSGNRNAGKAMLLEGGMKWQSVSLSPIDMDFINSKNISARDIAVAYGYPPVLLGLPEDNTYNNQKEARLALWTDTIMPMVSSLCDHLNRWLLPLFNVNENEFRIEPDYENIGALQPIRDAQWEKAKTSTDFLTLNERRELVGYQKIKKLDSILVPATMIPIDMALEGGAIGASTPSKDPTGTSTDDEEDTTDDDATKQAVLEVLRKASQTPMEVKSDSESDKREALTQDRIRRSIERLYVNPIFSAIDSAAKLAADAYRVRHSSEEVIGIFKGISSSFTPILKKMYMQASQISGKRVISGIKSAVSSIETKESDIQTRFELEMIQWASSESLSTSSYITEEVVDSARKIFVQAIIDGTSISDIARKLESSIGGDYAKSRAEKIAATEVHKSYNVAGYAAMQSTDLQFDKRWLSSEDAAVRPSHAAVNGQTIGQDERFRVGLAYLRFPGDPSTSQAKEVINCRCAVRYIPKGI